MFDLISATRERRPVRLSLSGCVLALAGLLLAGCLSTAEPSLQNVSGQNPPSAADPDSPEAVIARVEASEKALSPAYLQQRRQVIAELLEKNAGFGSRFRVKLTDAQLAGPKVLMVREWGAWLSHTTEVHAVYCAKVQLESVLGLYVRRTASIVVKNTGNGTETFQTSVQTRGLLAMGVEPPACYRMNDYTPFPELEQARARQRQVLGKID